jgi:hypothetical protein
MNRRTAQGLVGSDRVPRARGDEPTDEKNPPRTHKKKPARGGLVLLLARRTQSLNSAGGDFHTVISGESTMQQNHSDTQSRVCHYTPFSSPLAVRLDGAA